MSVERETVTVPTPLGGWNYPWDNVAELAAHVASDEWTLVGGLMVELHAALRGIPAPRTTVDVDLLIHVETARGRVQRLSSVLGDLGYSLVEPADIRKGSAHRFTRSRRSADIGGRMPGHDIVNVLVADHSAPRVMEKLRGFPMVPGEGGTQALRRTINARLDINGKLVELSVPSVLGALILKAAAHRADSNNPSRHLTDAAMLLACVASPADARGTLNTGSDRSRLLYQHQQIGDPAHPAWLALDAQSRRDAQLALEILIA